jgi:uncharacterized protein (UPF0218 family)
MGQAATACEIFHDIKYLYTVGDYCTTGILAVGDSQLMPIPSNQ